MTKRSRLHSAAEVDVVLNRSIYCYLQRAGVTSGIKRQIRRRERHQGKLYARRDLTVLDR